MQIGSDVFVLCTNGNLMPGVLVGYTYNSRDRLYVIENRHGYTYDVSEANVYCRAEGEAMLRLKRAERLVDEGYSVEQIADCSWHVWNEKRHGRRGGYVVCNFGGGHTCCTCPDFAKHDGLQECKHIVGLEELKRRALWVKPTVRVTAATEKIAA